MTLQNALTLVVYLGVDAAELHRTGGLPRWLDYSEDSICSRLCIDGSKVTVGFCTESNGNTGKVNQTLTSK